MSVTLLNFVTPTPIANARTASAGTPRRRIPLIVPARHHLVVHKLDQFAFGDNGVRGNQLGELVLVRQRAWQVEVFEDPVVKRTMHLEFQRADAVRDALNVIAQAVRVIVQRVDAPLVAGVMVRRMADAVQHGVAQPDVR
jgi:hypothetical protein